MSDSRVQCRPVRRAAPCIFALVLGACASAPPARVPEPRVTTDALMRAVQSDRPELAYALLDPELRAQLDRATFTARWRDERGELRALASALGRVDPAQHAQAELELQDGERVLLVLEDGQWRIASGVLDAQALQTPLDAVVELRRALTRQSLPALLRVLSRERRAAWLATFEDNVAHTADPLDLEVDLRGDEAVVHLRGGGEILLKREAGQWHVWDVK